MISAEKKKVPPVVSYLYGHVHIWLPYAIIIVAAVIMAAPFTYRWVFVRNDYASGGVNTVGNTTGNCANNAIACVQGDWIYYRNDEDNKTLYKMRKDGTMEDKVANTPGVSNINVVGQWIYFRYRGIFKVRVDGEGRTELTPDNSAYLSVVGDWIYYANFDDGCALYKIKTDGTKRQKVSDMSGEGANVVGDTIYLRNVYGDKKIYSMNTDGTNAQMVCGDATEGFNVSGGWIYYINSTDGGAVYKIKTDGTGKQKLADANARIILADGDRVYYIDEGRENNLLSVSISGEDRRLLAETDCMNVNVVSDIVCYTRISEGEAAPIHKIILTEDTGIPV